MRILLNSRKYDGIVGGVERMSIALMNEMVRRGHQVAMMSLDPPTAQAFYPIDPAIDWTRIDIGDPSRRATLREILARRAAMRDVIRRFRPDVGVGFQQGAFVSLAAAALGTGLPVIAAERNAPHRFEHLKDGHGRAFQYQSFRLARFLTVQFESYREHYPSHVRSRIVSIPNPVPPSNEFADPAGKPGERKTLLCVARLCDQKNQPVLVKAFAQLANGFADWDLVLVGDGDERPAREAIANANLAPERVRFTGPQANVTPYYCAAQLFCLSSRWEGFPNALAEAMTHGLPAVAFADCAGANGLIKSGRTGLLASPAGDPTGLARVLSELMGDADRRVALGAAAREVIAEYTPKAVFDQWEALFERAAAR